MPSVIQSGGSRAGAYKYGVISAVADTLLTILVNDDYAFEDTSITDNYYTKIPHGDRSSALLQFHTYILKYDRRRRIEYWQIPDGRQAD